MQRLLAWLRAVLLAPMLLFMQLGGAGAAAMQGARRWRVLLLDYHNATTTRSSFAAFQDLRQGWAFAAQVATWVREQESAPDDFTGWNTSGSPTVTADVDGTADEIGDSNGSTAVSIWKDYAGRRVGAKLRWRVKLKQDGDETRFPALRWTWSGGGGGTLYLQVNTKTGAYAEVGGSFDSVSITDDGAGYWEIEVQRTQVDASAGPRLYIFPAYANTLGGGTDASLTGSVVVKGQRFDDDDAAYLYTDQPRIYPDGVVLIEGERTNLLDYSNGFESDWSQENGVSSTGGQDAPDGSKSAATITDASTAGARERVALTWTAATTGDHTISVFFEKDDDETRFPEVAIVDGTGVILGPTVAAQINTKTGAVAQVQGTMTGLGARDAGDWWRLCFTVAVDTAGDFDIRVFPGGGTTLGTSDPNAQGSCTVFGAQIEEGSFASSYIPTAGGTETRQAEEDPVADGLWGDLKAADSWSVDVWLDWPDTDAPAGGTKRTLFDLDGTHSCFFRYTGAAWQIRFYNGASSPFASVSPSFGVGDRLRFTFTMSTGTLRIENLTAGGSWEDTSGNNGDWDVALPLYVGSNTAGANQLEGVMSRPRAA